MFFVSLAFFLLLHFYLIRRIWQAFEIFPKVRKPIAVLICLFAVSYFGHSLLVDILPFWLIHFLVFYGSSWIFAFLFFFLFLLIIDLARFINKYFNFLPEIIFRNYPKTKFITMLTVVLSVSVLYVFGLLNFTTPRVTELDILIDTKNNVQLAENSNEKKTLNIVAVSDLHLGYVIDKARLKSFVDLINAQNADIVFLLGDVIDILLAPVSAQKMDEELRQIKSKYGVYIIAGNHEHIRGDYANIMEFFRNCGFIVLEDSTVLLKDELYIVGRKDKFDSNRKRTAELTAGLDKSKPIILLDHQPYNLEHSVEADVDLHLSGHTHNGQFFPINLIVRKIYEISYGYLKKDNTHFYVTSGLGLWGPPIRIGTKSELVKIKMMY